MKRCRPLTHKEKMAVFEKRKLANFKASSNLENEIVEPRLSGKETLADVVKYYKEKGENRDVK